MKVFVAGHRGMLGHVVARYLAECGFEVVTSTARYEARPDNLLLHEIRQSRAPWVVNALGRIKQKCTNPAQLFEGNTLFPIHLAASLHPAQQLIHASTDCVFSGHSGDYSADAVPDPCDDYGLSKWLGERATEPNRVTVIRTSIIGPEESTASGLMSWFLAQTGVVNGFVNHRWNGLTTLEWSKMCVELIRGELTPLTPLFHVGASPAITKYELLKLIGDIWQHDVVVRPVQAGSTVDRSLSLTVARPPLMSQLTELRHWYYGR